MHFFKRVDHGYCPKIKSFSSFVLMQLEQEKPIAEVLERKAAFLHYGKHRF